VFALWTDLDRFPEALMTRAQIAEAIRALLRSGLTIREVAELRAHPRAIEALIGS